MKFLLTLLFLINSALLWAQRVPTLQQPAFNRQQDWKSTSLPQTQSVSNCNTWTFQIRLGSPLVAEKPSDLVQLPGSSYVLAGSDSAAAGIKGRFIKLNSQGGLLLSKEFSLGTQQLEPKRMRLFSNGNLYAVATATDPASGSSKPVLLCLDTTNLNILSVLQLNVNNSQLNWRAVDLGEGRDNTCFILSGTDSLINVTKLSVTGNSIAWSKTYRPRNKPRPVGIGVEYNDVYAAWNETDSAYSKGVVMDIDFTTGNYKFGSRAGGAADGLNIELQAMTMINLRPRITALQYKNGQYQFVRLNYEYNCQINFKEVFTVNGSATTGATISRQNAWGEAMATAPGNVATDITLIQTFPDNYNTPIRSWKLNYASPVKLTALILTNDGGHLVLNQSGNYPQSLVLTKTDSVANLPGCGVTPQTAGFLYQQQPVKYDTIPQISLSFQASVPTITVNTLAVTVTEDCKTLYCPAVPEPDTCLRTFFKEYRINTNSIVAGQLLKLDDGNLLLHCRSRGIPYVAFEQTFLTTMDTLGRVRNAQVLSSTQSLLLQNIIRLRDGNLLGAGVISYAFDSADLYLVKFDKQFNILWQKKLPTAKRYSGISCVLESSEGELYCSLSDRLSFNEVRTLLKLDGTGTPLWMREYNIGPNIFAGTSDYDMALVELGDAVILKYHDEDGDFSPHLMRIRKADGSVAWVRKYQMPGPYTGSAVFILRSLVSDGTNLYMVGSSQNRYLFLKIAADGSVMLAKQTPTNTVFYGWMGFGANGRLIASAGSYNYPGSINGVVEMDTSFTILRTQFMQIPRTGSNAALVPISDSIIFSAGSLWTPNPYWASVYLQKYNFNTSFASCAVSNQPVILETYNQPYAAKQIAPTTLTPLQATTYTASFSTAQIAYSGYYCGNNTTCSKISLQGPSSICDTANTYRFTVQRNPGCSGRVVWQMDTLAKQVQVVSITDTSIQLKIKSAGSFTLYAKLFASCGWLLDSLTVQATTGAGKLGLGPDKEICPGNTLVLHAGPGFASYLWQDGSADSVYTVRSPGLFYVQVSSCGNIFKDSVRITAAPPIPFDAGPDRTKCNSDTLHLTAPTGFLNYTWSNNYNISSLSLPSVVVNPLVDTAYYIKAEKTPGCFAYDTIHITVYKSPPIDLGRDTSFCLGDSVVLDAGSGFASYLWSNGATTQTIPVIANGAYSIVGTTRQGCKTADTLQVLQVYPLPVVQLDKASALCSGDTKTLDAGSFASYLWQDGSTARTFRISSTGKYSVTVTDNNGCKGSDTAAISTINPLPQNFLPLDTSICSYGKLELKPLSNYKTYLWSTGGVTPSITVTQPGIYWLKVQDNNNCKGMDSITVNPKQCLSGFYIPTAFTPNGDGKNDVFRPLLFGNVKQYQFSIYNRWGQVVFYTTEMQKGWNGKVAGNLQQSDVFVWTCTYQLEGEAVKMEKGTVTIIR